MRTITLTGLLLVAAPACGGGGHPSDDASDPVTPNGDVTGRVCDPREGALVISGSATVVLGSGGVLTTPLAADGWFTIENVPAGVHLVTVQSASYWREFAVEVVAGEAATLPDSDAVCAPPDPALTGVITGRVCMPDAIAPDDAGEPRPIAAVHVQVLEAITPMPLEDFTRPDGTFWLVVPTPAADLTVRATLRTHGFQWDGVSVAATNVAPSGTDLSATDGCTVLVAQQ